MATHLLQHLAPLVALLVLCNGQDGWTDPCEEGALEFTNHSEFDAVLAEYVQRGTIAGVESSLVDYGALRGDPSRLRRYLRQLCSASTAAMSPEESVALYCNAYNALMIAIIVHFNPPNSVRELHEVMPGGSLWQEQLATIAGEKVSLDNIEHDRVRAGLSLQADVSGRVHTCFVCASLSCPDLQTQAFRADSLAQQLTDATQQWLSNPTKNAGPQPSGKLVLSKIFDWYGDDFIQEGGSKQGFVNEYTSWNSAVDAPIAYMPYNWALNAVNGTGQFPSLQKSKPFPVMIVALIAGCSVCAIACCCFACFLWRRLRSKATCKENNEPVGDVESITISPRRLDLAIQCCVSASKTEVAHAKFPQVTAAALAAVSQPSEQ